MERTANVDVSKSSNGWKYLKRWGGFWGISIVFFILILTWDYWTIAGRSGGDSTQGGRWPVTRLVAVVVYAFVWWFIYAFTSICSGDWKKRLEESGAPPGVGVVWERRTLMVSFAYVFTILFLLFPLWSRVVTSFQSTQEDSLKIPIAIVVGCALPSFEDPVAAKKEDAKSVPKELRCGANTDQWVVNIGGTNVKCAEFADCPSSIAEEKQTKTEKEAGEPASGEKSSDSIPVARIRGGLVIPIYFIAVALMGGAVSLLRRVPEIQRRSEHDYVGTEKDPQLTPGEVRERLAFQIMQFISAPLIAITAYYAIGPETKIASVALAFTSGFASESILMMIRGVVDGIKPQSVTQPPAKPKGTASGVVVSPPTSNPPSQPVPNVTLSVVGQPTLTAISDSNGLFVIHSIPTGEQVIEASLNNQIVSTKVNISSDATTNFRIVMP